MLPILEAMTLLLTFFSATVFAASSQRLTRWHRQTISICCFRRPPWRMINQNRSLTFCSTQTTIHRVLGSHFMPPASVRNIVICHQRRIHFLPDKDGEEIGSICFLWNIPLIAYSGIFRNVTGRDVGLQFIVGMLKEGDYWWFQY